MQSTWMILYMLLFGIIAAGIWIGLNRKNMENGIKIYSIKSALFFFAGIWFLVSALKLYLGETRSTLLESFWDVESMTYLHYGIVFMAVSVMAPLLMKRVISPYGCQFVQIFDFIFTAAVVTGLFLAGRIENRTYCVLYVVSVLAGFGTAVLHHKIHADRECAQDGVYPGQIVYIGRAEIRSSFLEALPFVSTWAVMMGIYFPNELYIHNLEEFSGNYTTFFLITFVGSIVGAGFMLMLLLMFVPKKLFKIAYMLFGGVCCAGYLQGMFLNGALDALDGDKQVWSMGTILFNGVIWIAILSVAVIGGCRKTIVRKICKTLCVYISLIQLTTLGWLIITSDLERENENAAITKEGSLELSSGNNVLVFVLDNFDSGWFEAIYAEDNSILTPLADFTYYRNGTSQFLHTYQGIPCLLTGMEWNDDEGEEYVLYAYKNGDYLENAAAQGTDVKIYTDLNLMPDMFYQKLDNYRDSISIKYDIGTTFRTMIRTSIYKTAPFLMKPLYEYYTSDIKEMTYNEDIWSIDNDMLFYDDIVENRLKISDDYESVFRFYHMRGPHAPFYLTEDLRYEPTGRMVGLESQGKGSLKIVYEYMEQMKALGIYDGATIIITADHGQGDILSSEKYSGQPDKTSRPIFLVKKAKECHENMVINEAPVSQAELAPTILEALGIDHSTYGRTFEEIPVDEKRVRQCVDGYDRDKIVYSIDGHAADISSWSIESAGYD